MELQREPMYDQYERDDIGNDPRYAELARQVLLLIEEDEDDQDSYGRRDTEMMNDGLMKSFSPSLRQPGNYFGWSSESGNNSTSSVPAWLMNLRKTNGAGTGVFIPHAVANSRRKNKPRKRNSKGRKTNTLHSSSSDLHHSNTSRWQAPKPLRV